jgi:hypothetical protein
MLKATLVLSAVVLGGGATPAMAVVCARSAVVAVGQPEYFEFAAVSQAKATWARKVVRTAALGRPYSSWARARASRVTCRQIGGRQRCVAVGEPCRSGARP